MSDMPAQPQPPPDPSPTLPVLLLHGIWNAPAWLRPLAWRLQQHGLQTRIFGYPSVFGGPGPAIRRLAAHLRDSGPVHLLGHSLGGMIALEALRHEPGLPVRRVVCLGSPLCGSQTARTLARRGWTGSVLGQSRTLLEHGCPPWAGAAEVGMVAGSVSRGVGRMLGAVAEVSDGTVALAETRLPGLTDHCLVAASHTGLVFSPEAARQAAAFLRHGRFDAASTAPVAPVRDRRFG